MYLSTMLKRFSTNIILMFQETPLLSAQNKISIIIPLKRVVIAMTTLFFHVKIITINIKKGFREAKVGL